MSQHAPFTDAAVADRPNEFFDDVHFVLHLRCGDRDRAGSEPARPLEREAVARRLHAGDVARARQARRPEPGPRRQAVHAQGRAGSAGRGVGRSPVRRRVLRQVHRGPRGARLRPRSSRAPGWCSASATQARRGPACSIRGGGGRGAVAAPLRQRPRRRPAVCGSRCSSRGARPAFQAGLDQGDVITHADGKPIASAEDWQSAVRAHKPGDQMPIQFTRRGAEFRGVITLIEDPMLEVVSIESTGAALSADQKAFRDGWLGRKSLIPNP